MNMKQMSWWKQWEEHGMDRILPKATCVTGAEDPGTRKSLLLKLLAPFGQAPPCERLGWLEENHVLTFSSPWFSRGK